MLVGKNKFEAMCEEKGLTLAEGVYGKDHVSQHHEGKYYKMRYLKSYDCETGKIYAYPNGLPGWD